MEENIKIGNKIYEYNDILNLPYDKFQDLCKSVWNSRNKLLDKVIDGTALEYDYDEFNKLHRIMETLRNIGKKRIDEIDNYKVLQEDKNNKENIEFNNIVQGIKESAITIYDNMMEKDKKIDENALMKSLFSSEPNKKITENENTFNPFESEVVVDNNSKKEIEARIYKDIFTSEKPIEENNQKDITDTYITAESALKKQMQYDIKSRNVKKTRYNGYQYMSLALETVKEAISNAKEAYREFNETALIKIKRGFSARFSNILDRLNPSRVNKRIQKLKNENLKSIKEKMANKIEDAKKSYSQNASFIKKAEALGASLLVTFTFTSVMLNNVPESDKNQNSTYGASMANENQDFSFKKFASTMDTSKVVDSSGNIDFTQAKIDESKINDTLSNNEEISEIAESIVKETQNNEITNEKAIDVINNWLEIEGRENSSTEDICKEMYEFINGDTLGVSREEKLEIINGAIALRDYKKIASENNKNDYNISLDVNKNINSEKNDGFEIGD